MSVREMVMSKFLQVHSLGAHDWVAGLPMWQTGESFGRSGGGVDSLLLMLCFFT